MAAHDFYAGFPFYFFLDMQDHTNLSCLNHSPYTREEKSIKLDEAGIKPWPTASLRHGLSRITKKLLRIKVNANCEVFVNCVSMPQGELFVPKVRLLSLLEHQSYGYYFSFIIFLCVHKNKRALTREKV